MSGRGRGRREKGSRWVGGLQGNSECIRTAWANSNFEITSEDHLHTVLYIILLLLLVLPSPTSYSSFSAYSFSSSVFTGKKQLPWHKYNSKQCRVAHIRIESWEGCQGKTCLSSGYPERCDRGRLHIVCPLVIPRRADCPNLIHLHSFTTWPIIPEHSTLYNFISSLFTTDASFLYQSTLPPTFCVVHIVWELKISQGSFRISSEIRIPWVARQIYDSVSGLIPSFHSKFKVY